ncbi:aldose epimerase family protein [Pelomonas sp. SE-A7]|uniref:aldose epimerase family protein n=1 Tax=Pelomonas sp. SE-A7 TaxID=3054953 RepID=UPI00259C9E7A|nr:aldose epimerase family protein [Pelomonas sp. SE-A7]MDM4765209.1 aldose epimerase family protein [Pelomonas sp. SE-A7]
MPSTECREYGRLPDGRPVHEYRLDNGRGLSLSCLSYGGIVTGLWVPDANGQSANVVLKLASLDDYVHRNQGFGVIVGRYANRIANGRFMLDGREIRLDRNDGLHSLHGGPQGFGASLWQAEFAEPRAGEAAALQLALTSPDGDQGFPGRLQVRVRYSLGLDASWRIDYEAETDAPSLVNLSHHDYFNLAGHGSAMRHRLCIPASRYSEVDAGLIPLGHAEVQGTPFDFRSARPIVSRIRQAHEQLLRGRGYDHNFLLDAPFDGELHLAARLEDPASGRCMEMFTTEPALQFYSGNYLNASLSDGEQVYRQGDGLCLEPQHAPDSPNHEAGPDWPSTVLRPGELYRSSTLHRFSTTAA